MSGYTIAWLWWGAAFIAIEGAAILDPRPGDTLSEHLWRWCSMRGKGRGWRVRRLTLLAGLAWLSAHLLSVGAF